MACSQTHKATCQPQESTKRFAPKVSHPPRNFLLEDEDAEPIREDELALMRTPHTGCSPELLRSLQNPEIREIIRTIDSSANPLGALRSVLAQDKQKSSPFQNVCDEMLKAMNMMSKEGQSKF